MAAKNGVHDTTATFKVLLIGAPTIQPLERAEEIEVLSCEDVNDIPKFLIGAAATILVVELARLSESNRKRLLKLITQFQSARAIAIVDVIDQKSCEHFVRTGFVGALKRDEPAGTMVRALKAVAAGELWFPRRMLSNLLRGFLSVLDPNRPTTREMEIMALISNDLNNQQIADRLCLSRETIRWHIKSLHAKFGTHTRRALLEQAGLLNRLKSIPPQRESSSTRSTAEIR